LIEIKLNYALPMADFNSLYPVKITRTPQHSDKKSRHSGGNGGNIYCSDNISLLISLLSINFYFFYLPKALINNDAPKMMRATLIMPVTAVLTSADIAVKSVLLIKEVYSAKAGTVASIKRKLTSSSTTNNFITLSPL
jgi:hypothetical protein